MDIESVLAALAEDRPFFHSERDFQHALAWTIQQHHPEALIRLEPRPRRGVHLDLFVRLPQARIAIEVKYLVTAFSGVVNDERFEVPHQGAHDVSRYDVVKDVVRLEQLLTDGYADQGFAITLTNDPAYWKSGLKAEPVDAAFRIHEGRQLTGLLRWSPTAAPGTTAKRDQPLRVAGCFVCSWRPYATVTADSGRSFELRYLAIPVSRPDVVPTRGLPVSDVSQRPPLTARPSHRIAATAREEILLAVADLLRRSGRTDFTLGDLVSEMRRRGSQYSDATIRTHVTSRMCATAPDHHARTYDDFERLDRGRYQLRRPILG